MEEKCTAGCRYQGREEKSVGWRGTKTCPRRRWAGAEKSHASIVAERFSLIRVADINPHGFEAERRGKGKPRGPEVRSDQANMVRTDGDPALRSRRLFSSLLLGRCSRISPPSWMHRGCSEGRFGAGRAHGVPGGCLVLGWEAAPVPLGVTSSPQFDGSVPRHDGRLQRGQKIRALAEDGQPSILHWLGAMATGGQPAVRLPKGEKKKTQKKKGFCAQNEPCPSSWELEGKRTAAGLPLCFVCVGEITEKTQECSFHDVISARLAEQEDGAELLSTQAAPAGARLPRRLSGTFPSFGFFP